MSFASFNLYYTSIRNKKRHERKSRFASLRSEYHSPLSNEDKRIIETPIENIVSSIKNGQLQAEHVLRTYGKVAVKAHWQTNCITELLLPEAEVWARSEVNLAGPLAGVPISLKDSIPVKGFDATSGYACLAFKAHEHDCSMVKLLKDAGAVPYVKTSLPTTMMSFESASGLWGACDNPHRSGFTSGGSSGGEAAILALGGRIGIGSDIAGSVRIPAAWSGVFALRCSVGRWPKTGVISVFTGQEGVQGVYSPMARSLNDLEYFSRAIIEMQPWKYDSTALPIPWRQELVESTQQRPLRIGVIMSDGVVPPTPAISRALEETTEALAAMGHDIVETMPPDNAAPFMGLSIGSQLLSSDGCQSFNSPLWSLEPSDPGAAQLTRIARLPRLLRYLFYLYLRYFKGDSKWAYLIRYLAPKTASELWSLVARRESFRMAWHEWWNSQDLDFILCPVHATPALPHGAVSDAISSCGYTFLWNLLDYTAGTVPVGVVDRERDALPYPGKKGYLKCLHEHNCNNAIAAGAWMHYDSSKMAGLPTAVQVVGRRLEEEKVLGYMAVVHSALEAKGLAVTPQLIASET